MPTFDSCCRLVVQGCFSNGHKSGPPPLLFLNNLLQNDRRSLMTLEPKVFRGRVGVWITSPRGFHTRVCRHVKETKVVLVEHFFIPPHFTFYNAMIYISFLFINFIAQMVLLIYYCSIQDNSLFYDSRPNHNL